MNGSIRVCERCGSPFAGMGRQVGLSIICDECASDDDYPITVGDIVTFFPSDDGDLLIRGELLTGTVVETDLDFVDGVSTAEFDEPVHRVAVNDGGEWAIHPSWVVGRVGGVS